MSTLQNIYQAFQYIIQSFTEHPYISTISILIAIYIYWWVRKMLKFRYLLQIKAFDNHWQFAGIYDSPGAAYSALEYEYQHISDYRIKCLYPVRQIGWWKAWKLRREIRNAEGMENLKVE